MCFFRQNHISLLSCSVFFTLNWYILQVLMQRNFVLDTTNFSTNLVLNEPRETRTSGDSQLKCAVRLRSTLACPRPRPRRQSKPPYLPKHNEKTFNFMWYTGIEDASWRKFCYTSSTTLYFKNSKRMWEYHPNSCMVLFFVLCIRTNAFMK